ncbi:MAG: hypothetical protein HY362_02395 [Candidatus Aenigmarchaeota archaeon]|nr:hypothetical protein [Candidatus Aenigmarchaeota archaeon]
MKHKSHLHRGRGHHSAIFYILLLVPLLLVGIFAANFGEKSTNLNFAASSSGFVLFTETGTDAISTPDSGREDITSELKAFPIKVPEMPPSASSAGSILHKITVRSTLSDTAVENNVLVKDKLVGVTFSAPESGIIKSIRLYMKGSPSETVRIQLGIYTLDGFLNGNPILETYIGNELTGSYDWTAAGALSGVEVDRGSQYVIATKVVQGSKAYWDLGSGDNLGPIRGLTEDSELYIEGNKIDIAEGVSNSLATEVEIDPSVDRSLRQSFVSTYGGTLTGLKLYLKSDVDQTVFVDVVSSATGDSIGNMQKPITNRDWDWIDFTPGMVGVAGTSSVNIEAGQKYYIVLSTQDKGKGAVEWMMGQSYDRGEGWEKVGEKNWVKTGEDIDFATDVSVTTEATLGAAFKTTQSFIAQHAAPIGKIQVYVNSEEDQELTAYVYTLEGGTESRPVWVSKPVSVSAGWKSVSFDTRVKSGELNVGKTYLIYIKGGVGKKLYWARGKERKGSVYHGAEEQPLYSLAYKLDVDLPEADVRPYVDWSNFGGSGKHSGYTDELLVKEGKKLSPIPLWTFDASAAAGEPVIVSASPVISNGKAYIVTHNGWIFSLTTDGSILWKTKLDEAILLHEPVTDFAARVPINVTKIQTDEGEKAITTGGELVDSVVVSSANGIVTALNQITGEIVWKRKFSGYNPGAIIPNVTSAPLKIKAYKNKDHPDGFDSIGVVSNGQFFLINGDGKLEQIFGRKARGLKTIVAGPVYEPEHNFIYIVEETGVVNTIDANTFTTVSRFRIPGETGKDKSSISVYSWRTTPVIPSLPGGTNDTNIVMITAPKDKANAELTVSQLDSSMKGKKVGSGKLLERFKLNYQIGNVPLSIPTVMNPVAVKTSTGKYVYFVQDYVKSITYNTPVNSPTTTTIPTVAAVSGGAVTVDTEGNNSSTTAVTTTTIKTTTTSAVVNELKMLNEDGKVVWKFELQPNEYILGQPVVTISNEPDRNYYVYFIGVGKERTAYVLKGSKSGEFTPEIVFKNVLANNNIYMPASPALSNRMVFFPGTDNIYVYTTDTRPPVADDVSQSADQFGIKDQTPVSFGATWSDQFAVKTVRLLVDYDGDGPEPFIIAKAWGASEIKENSVNKDGKEFRAGHTFALPVASTGTVKWKMVALDYNGNQGETETKSLQVVQVAVRDDKPPKIYGEDVFPPESSDGFTWLMARAIVEDNKELRNTKFFVGPEGGTLNQVGEPKKVYATEDTTEFEYRPTTDQQGKRLCWKISVTDRASDWGNDADLTSETKPFCFLVRDTIAPTITSGPTITSLKELNPEEKITATLSANDNVNLKEAVFVFDFYGPDGYQAETITQNIPFRNGNADTSITIPAGKDGSIVKLSTQVIDMAGMSSAWAKSNDVVKVKDVTIPKINRISGEGAKLEGSIGEPVSFFAETTDNIGLDYATVSVNGKEESKVQLYSGNDNRLLGYAHFTVNATEEIWNKYYKTGSNAEVPFTVVVFDKAGNKNQQDSKFTLSPKKCIERIKPTASGFETGPTELLPTQEVRFGALLKDSVENTVSAGCGGLKYAYVQVIGEDGTWSTIYTATIANFTNIKTVGPGANNWIDKTPKTSEGKLAGSWLIPDPSTLKQLPRSIPLGMGGRAFDDNIKGVGTYATLRGGMSSALSAFGGRLAAGRLRIISGGEVTGLSSDPLPPTMPIGLPGTNMSWRVFVIDESNNGDIINGGGFRIKDTDSPSFVEDKQQNAKIVGNQKNVISACFRDSGVLKEIRFIVTEGGTEKAPQVIPTRAFADLKGCANYEYSNANLPIGTEVKWKSVGVDSAGNTIEGPEHSFVTTSNSPYFVEKTQDPARPVQGQAVTINAHWKDDNNLKEVAFLVNETGSWVEKDRKDVLGTDKIVSFTWIPSAAPGTSISWKTIATDVDGNTNDTDPSFVIEPDTSVPTLIESKQSKESVSVGGTVELTARWRDNGELKRAILSLDTGSGYKNLTTTDLSGSEAVARFVWQDLKIKGGTTVKWRIYAIDAGDNIAVTPENSFSVEVGAKSCPICPQPTEFGVCASGKQSRDTYVCDDTTNYECQLVKEDQSCKADDKDKPLLEPKDSAKSAIDSARTAIEAAKAKGINVVEAERLFKEAEAAFSAEKYADAENSAIQAQNALETKDIKPPITVGIETWIAIGVVAAIAIIAGVYMGFVRGRKPEPTIKTS